MAADRIDWGNQPRLEHAADDEAGGDGHGNHDERHDELVGERAKRAQHRVRKLGPVHNLDSDLSPKTLACKIKYRKL